MAGRTTVVIFGATGDLAQRKLLPALFELRCKGRLPEGTHIVAFARSEFPIEEFCSQLWNGVQELGGMSLRHDEWDDFAANLSYVRGDITVPEDMSRLRKTLESLEAGFERADRLFYLSIAPQLYQPGVEQLGASGLTAGDTGWRRVVIEKPFGWDLTSAAELNQSIGEVFSEDQVYRIDHYLGKETVQNLLVFRFANAIFEPVWNRNYIDNVQITVAESVTVGDRAGYYDRSGVVRDMVQNHLLQLLTLVAMEPPSVADAESLRDKKVEVLKAIRPWEPREAASQAVRGQYDGYLDEPDVDPDSTTATYAALRLFVDNWRWRDVPFYLRTGKAMAEKTSEITIQFQEPPHMMFSPSSDQEITPNLLGLYLQPDEGMHLKFQVKTPDQGMAMQSMDMEFHYGTAFEDRAIPEAYERLLEDALAGDASLFIRSDHIEEAWKLVDVLLDAWEEGQLSTLHTYTQGSWGPPAAETLLTEGGRAWHRESGGR